MKKFNGKIVGGAQYVHLDALNLLTQEQQGKVSIALSIIDEHLKWNVIKFDLKNNFKISLLLYEDFKTHEFPALLKSFQIDLSNLSFASRKHSVKNPPILHRKELLISPKHADIEKFTSLTEQLEKIGAFANISKFGTKVPWQENLKRLGINVFDHKVDYQAGDAPNGINNHIDRSRTAISRNSLSTPAKLLFKSGLASEENSYLDYGCGKGDDVKFLNELGILAQGWDPHFAPDTSSLAASDVVNLGFVINVIEDPQERKDVLKKAFLLTKKCLAVAVMLSSQNDTTISIPFGDGQITSTKTFQKYFEQKEIEEFLQATLNTKAIAAAPGVFFIFKDETTEQDYLLKRQLGIIRDYDPNALVTKINEQREQSKQALRIANNLAKHTLAFARKPELEELPKYFQMQLDKSGISFRRAFNAASKLFSEDELRQAVHIKREQILLFFAMYFFSGRTKYKSLSKSLQKDIRLHFGSMSATEEEAKVLLYSLGDEELIYKDSYICEEKGLGEVKDGKFTFQSKNLPKLPIRLRGVISVAERLAGSIEGANLLRIHIETKKVTYLTIPEFDTSPLPRILNRSIVDFRSHDVKNISHDQDGRVKTLYLKSSLMCKDDKNYKTQKLFDEKILSETNLDFFGEGPRFEDFAKTLLEKKILPPAYS